MFGLVKLNFYFMFESKFVARYFPARQNLVSGHYLSVFWRGPIFELEIDHDEINAGLPSMQRRR